MDAELKETIGELGSAFEQFKTATKEQLEAVKKHGGPDGLLTEKIETLNTAIGEINGHKQNIEKLEDFQGRVKDLEAKYERMATHPGEGRDRGLSEDQIEHAKAWSKWIRSGSGDSELQSLESKAMSVGSNADGGFAVPEELLRDIMALMRDASEMRSIATVRQIGTSDWRRLVNLHGTASGWVAETAARPVTATPTFANLTPSLGEVYANPNISQQALDDMFFNAEAWLAEEVSVELAEEEDTAFFTGDASNKPKGFLDYTTAATADSSRAFGTIEHVATGVAGDWPASNEEDVLIDLVYSLKARLRSNARFAVSKSTLAAIRKFRNTDGDLIWRPGLVEGQPDTLLGYPITESEAMPAVAANALAVAFGDFRRGYEIVDRMGIRSLRDPFTNKPYVNFYTTKRVGGHVVDSEAIKVLKFAAS